MNAITELTGAYDTMHPRFIDEEDVCPDVRLEGRRMSTKTQCALNWLYAPDKKCGRCKETKDKGLFARDKSEADGLRDWCRACISKADKRLKMNKITACFVTVSM